ncbi:MAG: serine/threonine protein kinase, partial [Cyanobacteria bacterium J06598_1]
MATADPFTADPQKKDAASLSSESLSTDENTTDTTYRFLHDRVQQAAYSLIPESEKQITHLKIGRSLLANMTVAEQEDSLFSIVSQMNLGSSQINELAERQTLCNLNLTAAQKAKSAAAYSASAGFLKIAIQLLEQSSQASLGSALSEQTSATQDATEFDTPKNNSWKFDYVLALQLHNLLAEASCLSGDFDGAAHQIAVILEQANTTLDRVFAYEIRMQLFIAQNQSQSALETGLEVLSLLNVTFQETILPDLDIERLYHLPTTSDPQAIAALSVLSKLWAPAFISKPELLPKVTLTMLMLSATYGNSVPGAFAYALYGMQLCGTAQDIELGYRFGKLALRTLERYETTDLTCKVNQLFHAFIRNWKEPAHKGVEALADNVRTGLETGDIEFACYSAMNYCDNLCIMGVPLRTIQPKQRYYSELTKTVRQDIPHDCILIWGQFLDNLTGQTDNPTQLVGEWFDEQTQLAKLKATNSVSGLFFVATAKMILSYLFGDYEGALEQADAIAQYEAAGYGLLPITQLPFYKSLALLALYNRATSEQQTANLTEIKIHQERLALWAAHAPENFQHKVDLVAAEIARVQQQPATALELYDRAIAGAQANGYIHEEAIANELAAKFYIEWGRSSGVHSKEKIAAAYLQEAYYSYVRWEAKAKTDELEQRYPQLLQPILQEATAGQNPMAMLGTIAALDRSHQVSWHTSTTTTHAST